MDKKTSFKDAISINLKAFKIHYKHFPKTIISIALHQIVTAISPYIAIFISARIIEELAGNKDPQVLWRLVIISLIAGALTALLTAISNRWKNVHNPSEHYIFLGDIYRKKRMEMDYCVTDSQKVKDLRSKIKQDINWGRWGFHYTIYIFEILVHSIISILSAVALTASLFTSKVTADVLLFLNSPVSLLVIIAIMLTVIIVSPIISTKADSYYVSFAEDMKFGNRFLSFFCFKAYSKERALDTRIYRQDIINTECFNSVNIFGIGSKFHRCEKGPIGCLTGISAALSSVLTGIIYVFVCLKSLGGAFGIGHVTQYVATTVKFASAMGAIFRVAGIAISNAEFLKTSFKYLDTENVMYRGTLTTEKRKDKKYEIEFKNVSFKYPDTDELVLKNVSFKFNVGERLAVVGENGSGKTTFIKLLSRMYEPTEGEILLNGIDIAKYNYDDYITIFSVVFQDFKLLSYSLAQNVAASTTYDEEKVKDCLYKAGFGDRLKDMPNGIDTHLYRDIEKSGVEISGGEAQKIAIARAIYKDAPFIILDEPTASLDPLAEAEIYTKFNEIVTDKTAVYISHRLSSCKFCDKIVVFDKGKIVETGSHGTLLEAEGKYKDLWHAQAQYYSEESA